MATKDSSTTREVPWESSPREILRKLQFLISTNNVTAQQLARTTGLSQKNVQEILDGVSLPTESMLRKCADFFGVTLEFVMGKDDGKGAKQTAPRSHSSGSKSGAPPAGQTSPKAAAPSGPLNLRTIATRHQALIELLIEKRVITAREYHDMVQKIEGRGR